MCLHFAFAQLAKKATTRCSSHASYIVLARSFDMDPDSWAPLYFLTYLSKCIDWYIMVISTQTSLCTSSRVKSEKEKEPRRWYVMGPWSNILSHRHKTCTTLEHSGYPTSLVIRVTMTHFKQYTKVFHLSDIKIKQHIKAESNKNFFFWGRHTLKNITEPFFSSIISLLFPFLHPRHLLHQKERPWETSKRKSATTSSLNKQAAVRSRLFNRQSISDNLVHNQVLATKVAD